MGSAFHKEVVRSITQSAGRFIAIVLISLLGAGFYAGLRMAAPDMRIAGDMFFDATNTYDISVVSTLGLDEDSIAALKGIDGVGEVMATTRLDAMVKLEDASYAASIESLPEAARSSDTSDGSSARSDASDYLNRPILIQGSWPQSPRECVVGVNAAKGLGARIGDEIVVEKTGESADDMLDRTSFTVSGFVNAPTYASSSQMGTTALGTGSIELYVFVNADAFSADAPYTTAYLTVAAARDEQWGTDSYDKAVESIRGRVDEAAARIAEDRYATVVGKAQRELDDARADYEAERTDAVRKLDDAAAELGDAARQLGDARAKLESASAELANAWSQLEESQAKLDAGEVQWRQGSDEVASRREELSGALAQLPTLKRTYEALSSQPGVPPEQLAALQAQIAQIEGAAEAIEQAQAQLDASRAELDAGAAQLAQGRADYDAGINEYLIGRQDLEQGEADYEAGRAEYEANKADAYAKFADAEADLAKAQADIDDIEHAKAYVLDRSKNPGAASLASDADGISQIATFLPFMFFLVAALVSLTSMTRMVDEERLDIGTHKALGYSRARIASKYLVYGLLASGIGSAVGIVTFGQVLPWFIMTSYAVSYEVPVFPTPIDAGVAAKALGLSLGVTLIATCGAAYASLRERPAALMLPRAPKAGKRIVLEHIGPLWKRFTFSQKVTARNLLRYKRRFFMAVIGIAGCTALLMVGFGLRDAIGAVVHNQYGELVLYDAAVRIDADADEQARDEVAAVLNSDDVAAHLAVDDFTMIARGPDDDLRIEVVVPQDERALGDFIVLRDRVSGSALNTDGKGIVLTEKAASVLGVQQGDAVTLYDENDVGDAEGEGRVFTVTGIAENYLGHYAYLQSDGYETAFGKQPSYDMSYVIFAPGADPPAFSDELLAIDGVSTVSFVSDKIATYADMLALMGKVIAVIILLSAALAFVVLYNLTNINIAERIREIATLKVLGFTRREVNAYIFREVFVMTIIGALIGCVLGVPLTAYIAQAAETPQMMFGREIELASFIFSFAITALFSVIVAFAMRRKLSSVDMVESLKSVE